MTFSADSQSLIIACCIQPVSKGIELDFFKKVQKSNFIN